MWEAGMYEKHLLTLWGGSRTVKRVVEGLREVSQGKNDYYFIKCFTFPARRETSVLMLSREHLKGTRFVQQLNGQDLPAF